MPTVRESEMTSGRGPSAIQCTAVKNVEQKVIHNSQGVLSGIPGGTEALNLERFPEAPRLTFESTKQSDIPSRRRA